jgi:hypothetical protein
MTARRLFVAFVIAVIGAGCVGDSSHEVQYRNTTNLSLNIYADSSTANPHLILPGETYKDRWVVPAVWSGARTGLPRQVEAKTSEGVRIFCHRYSYEELDRVTWIVQIEQRDDCAG